MGTRKSEALRRVTLWDDREKDKVLTLEEAEARAATKEDLKKMLYVGGNVLETKIPGALVERR